MFSRQKVAALSPESEGGKKTTTAKRRRGDTAEAIAENLICAQQHRVLFRNHQCRSGEIDLIAIDMAANELAIIEVRYRESTKYGSAASTVDARKQRRIISATGDFIAKNPQYSEAAIRFDIVAISGELQTPQCEWIRNAFDAF